MKTTRTRRSVEERISELEKKLEQLKASKNKRTRTEENRRRHLVGLAVLSEIVKDTETGRAFKRKIAPLLIEICTRDKDKEILSDIL
jgi:hypothetical protein